MAVAVMLLMPGAVEAQAQSWQDMQVEGIETMKDKFIGLAGAFDESQYDWRPMEGVRSVREVLGLAVAEANMFPTGWGFQPGPGATGNWNTEMPRAGALGKAEMLEQLETSFDYLIGVVRGMDDGARMATGRNWTGKSAPMHANIALAMTDMHEHLGQLIAYARSNEVVPPWSQGG